LRVVQQGLGLGQQDPRVAFGPELERRREPRGRLHRHQVVPRPVAPRRCVGKHLVGRRRSQRKLPVVVVAAMVVAMVVVVVALVAFFGRNGERVLQLLAVGQEILTDLWQGTGRTEEEKRTSIQKERLSKSSIITCQCCFFVVVFLK
jgi:hypothetical protein